MRQSHNGGTDLSLAAALCEALGHAVFVFHVNVHPRNHADHRNAQQIFDHLKTRLKDFDVASELIDDQTLDAFLFLFIQQFDRAVERGKHAARIDIADQDHGSIRRLGHGHIDDIALFQIDLGRTARAFNDDDIYVLFQIIVDLFDHLAQLRLELVIFHGRHGADGLAAHDDLTSAV